MGRRQQILEVRICAQMQGWFPGWLPYYSKQVTWGDLWVKGLRSIEMNPWNSILLRALRRFSNGGMRMRGTQDTPNTMWFLDVDSHRSFCASPCRRFRVSFRPTSVEPCCSSWSRHGALHQVRKPKPCSSALKGHPCKLFQPMPRTEAKYRGGGKTRNFHISWGLGRSLWRCMLTVGCEAL